MDNVLNISIDIVNDLKIRQRNEQEILGICPVCGCNDANFNIGKLAWRCWHCPSRGRIIAKEGYEIAETVVPELDVKAIRSLYSSFAESCHQNLTNEVVSYLKDKRGLNDETIETFHLGFCSDKFYDEYSNSLAEDAGLLYQDYPILSNRITIPYLYQGEVTDLRGRIIESMFSYKEHTATYTSLSGNHASRGATFLFNQDAINNSDWVILTEGEFKAIVGHQFGYPVVATPGIFGWQRGWSKLFKDKEVYLAADFDCTCGYCSPAYLMAKLIKKEVPKFKIILMNWITSKEKVDIDSLLLSGGKKSFDRVIEAAKDVDVWLSREVTKGARRRNKK